MNNTGKTRSFVILGVTGVLFILYNVIFFVLSAQDVHGASHWISYAFAVFAFIVVAVTSALSFGKFADARDSFMRIPIYAHSIAFLVAELLVSTLFMFIDYRIILAKRLYAFSGALFYPPQFDYVWIITFLVQFIILALHVIVLVLSFSAKNTIQNIGYNVQDKTNYLKLLKVDAEIIAQKCTDPRLKNAFMKFADDVRFSDPMSHESLFELERQIQECLGNAQLYLANGDNDGAMSCCNAASSLLAERNMKTKVLKH